MRVIFIADERIRPTQRGNGFSAIWSQPFALQSGWSVREVRGIFEEGDCVTCLDEHGNEFARGLVNYSAQALIRIKGIHTSQIETTLGYKVSDEVIHRDDLALL